MKSSGYTTKSMQNIPCFKTRHIFFKKNSFFLSPILEWNNLDQNIRNSSSLNTFRNSILRFITPSVNSIFNCHYPKNPICNYGSSPTYNTEEHILLSTLRNIDRNLTDSSLTKILRFGSSSFDTNANTNILNGIIENVLSAKRIDSPLFQ